MKLILLRRIHHNGQTFYGIFESHEKVVEKIMKLESENPNIPLAEYLMEKIELNQLVEIDGDYE